ncbi:MAG: sensor histidine kinase [Lautropia sp.]
MTNPGTDGGGALQRLRGVVLGTRPMSLLRWFSLTGAVSIAIVSLVLGVTLSRFLTNKLIERDAEVSRDFVQSIAETQNVGAYLVDHHDARTEADFIEFFAHVAAMPDVLRANVYSPQGVVVWSSQQDLIGRRFADNDELEHAVAGGIVTSFDPELHGRSKPEHILFSVDQQHFVEYYLPVRDRATGQVAGVVEIYKAPRALWEAVAAGNRIVWASALGSGLFLYLSLLWLIIRGDKALREQQARLMEAESLAFVGELSAAVAHSIRNPLQSIRSTAELAADAYDLAADPPREHFGEGTGEQAAPPTREPLDDIVRQVDRIEALMRTLLTYSRTPDDGVAFTDVGSTLKAATERYQPEFESRGTRVSLACDEGLPRVRGDSVLFSQALYSILANALDATGEGDRVLVVARNDTRRQRIDVTIIDTGKGIEARQVEQVFKPFFTTKSRGLGLGLALVRRIVHRFGGEVELVSKKDRGTCVTLHLPAASA